MNYRTHLRKIRGDLRKYKIRTLLVSASVFIGVLGTVALFSMGDIIVRQLEADLQPQRMSMLNLTLNTVAQQDFDNVAIITHLADQPGVTAVQAHAEYEVDWLRTSGGETEPLLLRAYAASLDDLALEPPRLLEGHYPTAGEIAITPAFADDHGLAVGDTLNLRGAGGEQSWQISGIVFARYERSEPGRRLAAFALLPEAQALAGRGDLTGLLVRFTDYATAEARAEDFVGALVNETPYIPVEQTLSDPDQNEQLEEARTNSRVLRILAVIALVVSGFLVANAIGSLVMEQRPLVGVMKTLGATPTDLTGVYAGLALGYGLLGVLPGVLLGVPTGNFAAQQLSGALGTHLDGFTYSIPAIVYGTLLGLLVPVIAALLPVLRALRVSILEAFNDRGIDMSYGRGPMAQGIARLPLPATIRQSLNNLNRQKLRLAFTVLTMTIAVAAFMGIFAVLDSVVGLITSALDTIQADVIIRFDDPADFAEAEALITEQLDGLRAMQPGMQIAIEIEGYNPTSSIGPGGVFASGFDTQAAHSAYRLNLVEGAMWDADSPADGVIITERMAEALGQGVGDHITLRAAGRQQEFPIIAVSTYPFDGVFMDWHTLALVTGFVRDDEPASPAAMLLMTDTGLNAEQLDDMIDEVDALLATHGIGASYQNFEAQSELILSRADIFRAIFSAAVLFIAVIGALGLLSTLSISVFERRREIGIMRSVGASSTAIGTQFFTEGLVVGVMAWLVGVPLSIGLSLLLSSAMAFGDAFQLVYPLEAVIYGLGGILAITSLASLYPALTAASQSVSHILRYQ